MSHRFDGPPRTSVPTVVISNCILVRATNETPWRFNTSSTASRSKHAKDACFSHRRRLSLRREQAPALRWQHQIASKSVQQKKTDMQSVRSKGRPRSRALRAPSGFDSVPPVSFLSDTSYRATARNEPSRTAMRHRAKRRWNLGRDSAQG